MKIDDLTTLELLSTDELNRVAGGRGYYRPYGRFCRKFKKFNRKMRKDMPTDPPIVIDLPGPGDNPDLVIAGQDPNPIRQDPTFT